MNKYTKEKGTQSIYSVLNRLTQCTCCVPFSFFRQGGGVRGLWWEGGEGMEEGERNSTYTLGFNE
jgi:hypothetical protein